MSVRIRFVKTRLENYVRDCPEKAEEAIGIFQQRGVPVVLEAARDRAPIGKTGFLRESMTANLTPRGFTVKPTMIYAAHVEYGTRPHMIFPRVGQFLRWETPLGEVIFAKKVHHPGFPGRFYMQQTAAFVKLELKRLWSEIIEEVFGEVD